MWTLYLQEFKKLDELGFFSIINVRSSAFFFKWILLTCIAESSRDRSRQGLYSWHSNNGVKTCVISTSLLWGGTAVYPIPYLCLTLSANSLLKRMIKLILVTHKMEGALVAWSISQL